MSKSKDVVKVEPSMSMVPDFLREEQAFGLDVVKQYFSPPRVKIIQKQSNKVFTDKFDAGDVIIMPSMVLLAPVQKNDAGRAGELGVPFYITPLFFWPEWYVWNPLEMKGTLNAIRDRTLDARDPIAAKSRDSKLWFEPCPENKEYSIRYVEHLNFIFSIHGEHELAGMPIAISFAKGEHRVGSNFSSLITMRKAPICAGIYQMRSAYRPNNTKGQWYGIDVSNPPDDAPVGPWLRQDQQDLYQTFKAQHLELKDLHERKLLVTEFGDDDVVDTEVKPEF